MAENGVIGCDGGLPWRLPKDLKFFMAATLGKPVIMGRKTFETLKAPLPGRTNIVMTRDPQYSLSGVKDGVEDGAKAGVKVVVNFAEALKVAKAQCQADGVEEIMVAGGADIYRLGLLVATRLYVTRVHAEVEGDTWFPEVDWSLWQVVRIEVFDADERHSHPFSITVYNRS